MSGIDTEEFRGRVAFVSGASRGIGAASARAFAARGATVVIADILEDEAQGVVEEINGTGGAAEFVRTDIGDPASVRSTIDGIVERHGRLDFAHNNAGIFRSAPLAELDDDDWDAVVRVNFTGLFHAMKHQLRHMIAAGAGAIVNTASVWSFAGSAGQVAYVATKHGVIGLTKNAAIDHGAQGIRINAIAPGPIETPMTAVVPTDVMNGIIARTVVDRYGQPDEVAEAAVWLCSDRASYVNGSVLAVDGGWLA